MCPSWPSRGSVRWHPEPGGTEAPAVTCTRPTLLLRASGLVLKPFSSTPHPEASVLSNVRRENPQGPRVLSICPLRRGPVSLQLGMNPGLSASHSACSQMRWTATEEKQQRKSLAVPPGGLRPPVPGLREPSGAWRPALGAGRADPRPGATSGPAALPPTRPVSTQLQGPPVPTTPEPSGGFVAGWASARESAPPDLLRRSPLILRLPLPKVLVPEFSVLTVQATDKQHFALG